MLICFLLGCIFDNNDNDEHSGITSIEITYQIKVDYNGNNSFLIQVPLFVDENNNILKINDKFKIISGNVTMNYNQTEYGPTLMIISNKSFFIEINETYEDKKNFTPNTAELSLLKTPSNEYWVYSNVTDTQTIKLFLYERRITIRKDGVIGGESIMQYYNHINYGWNPIKVISESVTE
jgi:hypothetical protein